MAGKLSRRDLLKVAGVGAGVLVVPAVLAKKAHAQATAHGVLVDTRRCVNCKACQIACKLWNHNTPDPTSFKTSFSEKTWTYVQENEGAEVGPTARYVTTKRQCMHCEDPVCVKLCPMDGSAIHKQEDGPVLINHANCMRCLSCVRNCPYSVPKLDVLANKVVKCVFCHGRLGAGMEPACVASCVADALYAGTLEEITTLANTAIGEGCSVYGLDTGWKTSWVYIFPAGVNPPEIVLP